MGAQPYKSRSAAAGLGVAPSGLINQGSWTASLSLCGTGEHSGPLYCLGPDASSLGIQGRGGAFLR